MEYVFGGTTHYFHRLIHNQSQQLASWGIFFRMVEENGSQLVFQLELKIILRVMENIDLL